MFTRLRTLAGLAALAFVPAVLADEAASGMKKGTPEMKAAGALAFGPDGILFVADAPNSTVFAIATGDTKPADVKSLSIPKVDEAIGGLLGTTGSDILINDMKVNPASGNVYLSVARGKGPDAAAAHHQGRGRRQGGRGAAEGRDVLVGQAGQRQPRTRGTRPSRASPTTRASCTWPG